MMKSTETAVTVQSASQLSIWTAMIAIYVVWGSTYLAIRFAVETLPPFLMAAARFLAAGAILYIWQRMAGAALPTRKNWISAAVIGTFLLVGGNGGVVWAEQRVVSGIAALMVGSVPLWMALIDILRPGKDGQRRRLNWMVLLGLLIGFGGIAILIEPAGFAGAATVVDPIGAVVLIFAAFSWAIGSLYSRNAELPKSALLGTGMEMLAGGAVLLLIGTISGEWGMIDWSKVSALSVGGLAYLIIFGSLVGFAAYTWLLRTASTSLVSTYAYVNPVVAIFLGNLFGQEPVTPRVLLAAAVILGAVALITLNQPKKKQ